VRAWRALARAYTRKGWTLFEIHTAYGELCLLKVSRYQQPWLAQRRQSALTTIVSTRYDFGPLGTRGTDSRLIRYRYVCSSRFLLRLMYSWKRRRKPRKPQQEERQLCQCWSIINLS